MEKPGTCHLPRDLGLRVLEQVYGFRAALDYASYVLGSPAVVAKSPWDAYVVAVPTESEELKRLARDICAARTGPR